MASEAFSTNTNDDRSRGHLLRRVIVFQVKLFLDGLRDLVFSPLSIVAAALGFLFARDPHAMFDRLMRAGHGSDRWIDLFDSRTEGDPGPSFDGMIGQIETVLRNDHASGGLTAEAERRLRTLMEELQARAAQSGRQGL